MTSGLSTTSPPPPVAIREFLAYALSGYVDEMPMPSWPPDVFAIAASLLQKSGAYNYVVRNWPPKPLDEWVKEMQQLGLQWRQNWAYSSLAPDAVQAWWKAILANQHSTISDIRDNKPLCEALIAPVSYTHLTLPTNREV